MASSQERLSLSEALENLVIPWVQRGGMSHLFVAVPAWQQGLELPKGMTAEQYPMRSARVLRSSRRHYGASSVVEAVWPEDKMHSARTPKLCFVLTGTAIFRVADYAIHCRPGYGVLLPAGIPFSNNGDSSRDQSQPHLGVCEILMMLPYQAGLLCWISRRWHDEIGNWHVNEESSSIAHSQVSQYLHRLVAEAEKKELHHEILCDALLRMAVTLLHRELQQLPVIQTGEISFPENLAAGGQQEYSMAQAQKYIHSHLREPLSIDKVARFVCMSRTAFTQHFRAQTGQSFTEYVQNCRFEEASKLLKGTDLAIGDVGSLVGMKPCRMRAIFQKREGISPLVFRKRHRLNKQQ